MVSVILALALLLSAAPQNTQEERPKIPKDSAELVVHGCLTGRVLAASEARKTDVESGPPLTKHTFRLAGKKDMMKAVKEADGQLVEVTGLVKKNDLASPPGVRIGNTRIVVGGGYGSSDPNRRPDPAEGVVVMDVTAVRVSGGTCGKN
ncbi:MAG: hypothetical protein DMF86_10225 [Acidobacteria bacterium]|nr:MAG: hypothetical protein DMF86_10225 [Acidobacteriota bacterium]